MILNFIPAPGSDEWRLVANLRHRLSSRDVRDRLRTEMSRRRSYGIPEVAMLFGVPQSFVRREIENGRLHAIRKNGRVFIQPAAIDEWLLYFQD